MIITSTDIQSFQILLAAHHITDTPKLSAVTWLNDDDWQDSKTLSKLKIHYKLDDNDIIYIDENSLSSKNLVETLLLATIAQLNQFALEKRQAFSLPLDTSTGTPFQQKVWQALQDIEYGQTMSYAQLAQNIGDPKAFRAVANANGKNPFSIIIPCHRVIASDGGLGGYTGGLDKKEWLLDIEKRK